MLVFPEYLGLSSYNFSNTQSERIRSSSHYLKVQIPTGNASVEFPSTIVDDDVFKETGTLPCASFSLMMDTRSE